MGIILLIQVQINEINYKINHHGRYYKYIANSFAEISIIYKYRVYVSHRVIAYILQMKVHSMSRGG